MTASASCKSPNVFSVGDVLWCSLYGFGRLYYPGTEFLVRVAGFDDDQVNVEALVASDDPFVENAWTVPFRWLRRERP